MGKKTAIALLRHFQDLQGIYANLTTIDKVDIRGAKTLGKKLEQHEAAAILARKLTGIDCHAPFEYQHIDLKPSTPDIAGINALYDQLGIGTALRRQAERIENLIN